MSATLLAQETYREWRASFVKPTGYSPVTGKATNRRYRRSNRRPTV